MLESWKWGTYIFFAVFLGASIIWVHFALPETKGATLEEMDRVFGSNAGAEDSVLLEQARRDVGLTEDLEDSAIHAEKKGLHESHHESA